jgi:hypothetical protein
MSNYVNAFRWLGPPADLVRSRLCRGATVCFVCIWTPSLSPYAAEYFHLVAPGPVLGGGLFHMAPTRPSQ